MTLETRPVTLSAEQWRHVILDAEDNHAEALSRADAIDAERWPEEAVQARQDADFTHAILTSLRSAGA